jgi:DNA-binding transcriptional MerR regulator
LDKAPEAFRTISEVADELDVPKHVLRFWEAKFAQLKPMKRGGGRRYYRPEDVALLRGIRVLLYNDGYTIRGVQKLLREQGPRYVMDYRHRVHRRAGDSGYCRGGCTKPKIRACL